MTRINPLDSLNLDEFQPKTVAPKPKVDRQEIAQLAEQNGFPSRQAPAKTAKTRARQHYFRTGRNVQINIKGTAECNDHLSRLVEEIAAPKGVILEEALAALETVKAQVIARLDRDFPNRRNE